MRRVFFHLAILTWLKRAIILFLIINSYTGVLGTSACGLKVAALSWRSEGHWFKPQQHWDTPITTKGTKASINQPAHKFIQPWTNQSQWMPIRWCHFQQSHQDTTGWPNTKSQHMGPSQEWTNGKPSLRSFEKRKSSISARQTF